MAGMKLKLLQFVERRLRSVTDRLLRWHEEIEWRVIANTPVGPNPHEKGTVSWFLWEEGNKLKAHHRLKVVYGPNPWVEMMRKRPWTEDELMNAPKPQPGDMNDQFAKPKP